ncbi:hypothetical protein M3Y94_01198700 [Aphelenchoides besseyi]|nr:hypothetical protein M3Y94_01198700 [Aphelenchoides besseyi]
MLFACQLSFYSLTMDSQSMNVQESYPQKLNPEQVQWLLNHMSSDDQKELTHIMKSCTSEMTLTRGLPFAALTIGSLYFARSRLPENLRFGPKRWPFYALIGIGALTAANVLSMNKCADRVNPKLVEIYTKYNQQQANSTHRYDELRRQNRSRQFASTSSTPLTIGNEIPESQQGSTVQPRFIYDQPGPTISGTPSRSARDTMPDNIEMYKPSQPSRQDGSGTKYGDSDFS